MKNFQLFYKNFQKGYLQTGNCVLYYVRLKKKRLYEKRMAFFVSHLFEPFAPTKAGRGCKENRKNYIRFLSSLTRGMTGTARIQKV